MSDETVRVAHFFLLQRNDISFGCEKASRHYLHRRRRHQIVYGFSE